MATMVSVDEAQAAIRERLSPFPAETVSIEAAYGRICAAPILAAADQPPFEASAMDGYAVRLEDASRAGARLEVVGVSAAGERFDGALGPGDAVRIYTGAPIPPGADHVIVQEHVTRDGDTAIVDVAQSRQRNIRAAGIDFRKGDLLIAAGTRLTGPKLALAAAGGADRLSVTQKPRVALIANGDELVPPGRPAIGDQIVCSIPYGLAPMIEAWGGAPQFLGIARDDISSIRQYTEKASAFDVIVPIGGASVGDRDLMRGAFSEIGFKPVFEKVSMKPGKPTWFGFAGDAAVLGLPGNPASALVAAILFLRPALKRLGGDIGEESDQRLVARLAAPLDANGPREAYLRAKLSDGPDGVRLAAPFDNQDSSLLSVMAGADILIRRPPNAPSEAVGALVECVPY